MFRLYLSLNNTTCFTTLSSPASNDHALAKHRLKRFMSDNTAATILFQPSSHISEEAIISKAKERMAAKLLALEDSLNNLVGGKL